MADIERLERTDPLLPVELVSYDADGRETARKSPTAEDIVRVRRRERKAGTCPPDVWWSGGAEVGPFD